MMTLLFDEIIFVKNDKSVASLKLIDDTTLSFEDFRNFRFVEIKDSMLSNQDVFDRLCSGICADPRTVDSVVLKGYDKISQIDDTLISIRFAYEGHYIKICTPNTNRISIEFDNVRAMYKRDIEEIGQADIQMMSGVDLSRYLKDMYGIEIVPSRCYLMIECMFCNNHELGKPGSSLFIRKVYEYGETEWESINIIELLNTLDRWAYEFSPDKYNWIKVMSDVKMIKNEILKGEKDGKDNKISEREGSSKTS